MNKIKLENFIEDNINLIESYDYKNIYFHPILKKDPELRNSLSQVLMKINWFNPLYLQAKNHMEYLMQDLYSQALKLNTEVSFISMDLPDQIFDTLGWNYSFSFEININSKYFKHPETYKYNNVTQEYEVDNYKMKIPTIKTYEIFDYKLEPRPKLQLRRHLNLIQSDINLIINRSKAK